MNLNCIINVIKAIAFYIKHIWNYIFNLKMKIRIIIGDKFFIGELFIRSGNKDIIRYSCLFFCTLPLYLTNIWQKKK